jgi:hypothetical protein
VFALGCVVLPAIGAPASAAVSCPSSWTVAPVQISSVPALQTQLNGVSLDSEVPWTVGGLDDKQANTFHAFAEHLGSSGWTLGDPTDAGGETVDTWLNDVAGFPADQGGQPQAWAVGYAGPSSTYLRPQMIFEHWTGPDPSSPWELVTPQLGGTYSDLISVSGTGPSDVWAVGYLRDGTTYRAMIMHRDGHAWAQAPAAALPPTTTASGLIAVSAVSPKNAWAVGYRSDGTGYRTLVEHYDGSRWTAMSTPNPGSAEDVLLGVSARAGDVWAVGYRSDGTVARALVEHYDGNSWSDTSPGPYGDLDVLRSVTVLPSADQVWAAGFSLNTGTGVFEPLVVRGDASGPVSWSRSPTAEQNGTVIGREFKEIAAVPGALQLWAVGSTGEPIAETICPVPPPTAAPTPPRTAEPASATTPSGSVRSGSDAITPAAAPRSSLTIATDVGSTALPGEPASVRTNGATIGDFAGPYGAGKDGYPDFELGRFTDAPMELWVNQQDGTWKQIGAGTFPEADRYGCAFGDIGSEDSVTSDGLPDLFCTIGAAKGTGIKVNELWMQRTDGSFVRSLIQPATLDPFGRGRDAAIFYAGDKRAKGPHPASLFLANQLGRGDGVPDPNRFYLNRGGALVDTPAAGLDVETGTSCVQPVDVNRDHLTDLLVCTNLSRLALFENLGTNAHGVPRFREVSRRAGIAQGGVVFGRMQDMNGDVCPDLIEEFGKRIDLLAQATTSTGRCAGTFSRVWSRTIADGKWLATGDVNGDHHPDLYVLQGHAEPDLMLLNGGSGRSFSSIPIPEASEGNGDVVLALKDPSTGASDFLVLNGDHAHGPVQLIRFVPNPSPDPVTITSAPPTSTTSTTATFEFTSSAGTDFVCSLDGIDPVACTSGVTYHQLALGRHRFAVWAEDASGAPLAEATASFTVAS